MSIKTTGSLKAADWKATSVLQDGFIENDAAGNFSFGNTGSVGSSLWAHKETKVVASDTDTLTFAGLDGDTEEVYKLIYYGNKATATGVPLGGRRYVIQPNGVSDIAFGSTGDVLAFGLYGGDLIAGGQFTWAGGFLNVYSPNIARWNGTSWSAIGGGVNDDVNAITTYGGDLVVGGIFTQASGASANRIARWDGSSWSTFSTGMNGTVNALTVFGGDLIAAGTFTTAGGTSAVRIARWNGVSWLALGTGINGTVRTLAVFGGELVAGGVFTLAGGVAVVNIAKWNGSTWSAMSTGLSGTVGALVVYGVELIAGGSFNGGVRRWNGVSWLTLGPNSGFPLFIEGVHSSIGESVSALAVFGGDLIVGGFFAEAGGVPPLPTGTVLVSNLARWTGAGWAHLGSSGVGTNGPVTALFDYGLQVYIGGGGSGFSLAGGVDVGDGALARWDGSSTFSAVGGGISNLGSQQTAGIQKGSGSGEGTGTGGNALILHRDSIGGGSSGYFSGVLYFYAKSGKARTFFNQQVHYLPPPDTSFLFNHQYWGHWANTIDNITSLVLKETFSGLTNGFTTGSVWSLYVANRA